MGERYVVAVRRDKRHEFAADLAELLDEFDGVQVTGVSGTRAQIVAEADGLEHLRDALGEMVHIEAVVEHQPRADTREGIPGENKAAPVANSGAEEDAGRVGSARHRPLPM